MGATLLCAIHSTTIKNTLFENGDDANAFRAFNLTQTFLHLKNKIVIDPYGARTNILAIVLLFNSHFFKIFFKKYIEILFYYFF